MAQAAGFLLRFAVCKSDLAGSHDTHRNNPVCGTGACPAVGNIIWLDFDPTQGHEQQGRRPALVLTPQGYNELSELCVVCPITGTVRGSSFEVQIPDGHKVKGAILTNQVRTLSWPSRGARFAMTAPSDVLEDAREKFATLLGID